MLWVMPVRNLPYFLQQALLSQLLDSLLYLPERTWLSGELVHLFSQETQSSLQLYWAFSWSLEATTTSAGSSGERDCGTVVWWTSCRGSALRAHGRRGSAAERCSEPLGCSRCSPLTSVVSILFSQRLAEGLKGFLFWKVWLISHLSIVCFCGVLLNLNIYVFSLFTFCFKSVCNVEHFLNVITVHFG